MTKSPFARLARMYSGSPWMLWMQAISMSIVAPLLLTSRQGLAFHVVGAISAILALNYYGSILYYYKHRVELSADPTPPVRITARHWIIAIAIIVVLSVGFLALEASSGGF